MIYITELLLYVCFAVLVGSQILLLVPETRRPTIEVPNWIVYLCILGIALLSFFPILDLTLVFAESYKVGFWVIFKGVLQDFSIGHAWLITLFLSVLLIIVRVFRSITGERIFDYVSAIFTFALILAFGWASHCAANYQLKGFIPHAIHFLSVCVWIGVLFVVSWFAKNTNHWLAFLRWFSPVAIVCVVTVITAGFFLMDLLVPDYVNAWIVPYGQALLIKHLAIIPLLTFAFINGVLAKIRLRRNPDFNPLPWVKAESFFALLVLSAMAVMGQQSPPEDIATIIQFERPSALFEAFYPEVVTTETTISSVVTGTSIVLAALALSFLVSAILFFRKQTKPGWAITMSLMFIGSAYVSIMLSIQ